MNRTRRSIAGALCAGLLVVAAGAAAEETQDSCREECREARRTCHAAARAADRVCHDRCADAVETAIRRALRVCEARDLESEACRRLVREASAGALSACREGCARAFERARARCQEERHECVRACLPPIDPVCAEDCVGDFGACRDDLGTCVTGCGETAADTLEECRELYDPEAPDPFRECVAAVRREARECRWVCHEDSMCGPDLRECLAECPAP